MAPPLNDTQSDEKYSLHQQSSDSKLCFASCEILLLHINLQQGNCNQHCTLPVVMAHIHICPHRPCKKPLSPLCTVQMSDTKDSPVPIPLLAAALGGDSRTVLLAYGKHLQPVMEGAVSTQEAVKVHVCSVFMHAPTCVCTCQWNDNFNLKF